MQTTKGKLTVSVMRIVLTLVSVLFIIYGVLRHEHLEVMQKAVKICLECIGIG